jgi:hypothetical protein
VKCDGKQLEARPSPIHIVAICSYHFRVTLVNAITNFLPIRELKLRQIPSATHPIRPTIT